MAGGVKNHDGTVADVDFTPLFKGDVGLRQGVALLGDGDGAGVLELHQLILGLQHHRLEAVELREHGFQRLGRETDVDHHAVRVQRGQTRQERARVARPEDDSVYVLRRQ